MAADLSVVEDADVVLALEAYDFTERDELTVVFPSDEVIAVTAREEMVDDLLKRLARCHSADEEILTTRMMDEPGSECHVADQRMYRRIETPKTVFKDVDEIPRIGHVRPRQRFLPMIQGNWNS